MVNDLDINELEWDKGDGLLAAVVQDADTARVLMLGYMSREALETTIALGRVTFYSRSRKRLWTKGETSGNLLELVSLEKDCDADAILVLARPAGPTCHLGRTSCFEGEGARIAVLGELDRVIGERLEADPVSSYTARLLAEGPAGIARKLGEESVETVLAAVGESDERLTEEAADLFYHLLVLLRSSGLGLSDLVAILASRRG